MKQDRKDETDDGIMYTDVPMKNLKTLYTKVGDVLGGLCVFGRGYDDATGETCKWNVAR